MIYYWFIIGAAIGSFLNVCIHRLPRGESIIFPPSHCPNCQKKLLAFDLIPIVGYLLLRGRCRFCQQPISPRYPLVELISGLFFTVSWATTGGDLISYLFQVIFLSVLIIIFFIDLENQVIPDVVSLPGIALGLIFNFVEGMRHPGAPGLNLFVSALYGMTIGFGLLFIIARLGKWWFKQEAMGDGDWYLGALLGAYLGWAGVLLALFISYLAAGLAAVLLLAGKRAQLGEYIPFGPALVFGGIITLFWGGQILNWYLGLFL